MKKNSLLSSWPLTSGGSTCSMDISQLLQTTKAFVISLIKLLHQTYNARQWPKWWGYSLISSTKRVSIMEQLIPCHELGICWRYKQDPPASQIG